MGQTGRGATWLDPAAWPVMGQDSVTILVVDDDPLLRQLVQRMLSREGYQVLTADGGEQALRLADEHRIDLLLTDVVMPGMDGRELAEALLARQPAARVLFMSGCFDGPLAAPELQDLAILLIKPFSRETLASRIEQLLLI